jgi:hypothetical protein
MDNKNVAKTCITAMTVLLPHVYAAFISGFSTNVLKR